MRNINFLCKTRCTSRQSRWNT